MKSMLMLLRQLGFDDAQAQVYMEIANSGPITVLELSRSTNIKRTTVHFYVEQLLQKGLVVEGVRRGRRVLSAVEIEKLAKVVEDQKQQVAVLERSLEKVVKEMSASGNGDQSYGVGFVVEDGASAIERVYREALECGEVVSYLDVLKLDGLQDIRIKLFGDLALRQSLYSFKELYFARDPGFPDYAKKLKAFKPFIFTRTGVKLGGNVVNVLVYEKTVAIIVRDTEWKVLKLQQPVVAQLLGGMMEGMVG